MGWATVASTTSASAPGYRVVTETCGGTISGNCATGIWKIASRPARVMTIETTKASRGRSMKTPDIMAARLTADPGRQHRLLHDLARSHLLDAVHDHVFAIAHAGGHDDVCAKVGAGLSGSFGRPWQRRSRLTGARHGKPDGLSRPPPLLPPHPRADRARPHFG